MSGEDLKVRVAVRVRPLNTREKGDDECVTCTEQDGSPTILIGEEKQFSFDYVFPPTTSQQQVYQSIGSPLVEMAFSGYNVTLLAYGQTGSGKTFTMGTGHIMGALQDNLGIIPRVAQQMFEIVKANEGTRHFNVKVSFVELYNEDFKDLFDPVQKAITVKEDKQEGIMLSGVVEKPISTPDDLMTLLELGSLSRTTHSTNMNEGSSRSHAIFTCRIEQYVLKEEPTEATATTTEKPSGENEDPSGEATTETRQSGGDVETMTCKFHFVDLAGSERAKRTGAEGLRLKEGISINSGLLALGNVISALGDPTKKSQHVPYRDSRLTRLLQDSLGGNSRTLMIACVSPADSSFNETLNTLRYANRARNIQNKAIINRDPVAALITALRKEVADLKQELRVYRGEEAPKPKVDEEVVKQLEGKFQNEVKNRLVLESQLLKVAKERDCYILKLKTLLNEEDKEQMLQKIQDEFQDNVKDVTLNTLALPTGAHMNLDAQVQSAMSLSLQSTSSTSNSQNAAALSSEQEALKTKIMMMKSLMSRDQQARLQKMEDAFVAPGGSAPKTEIKEPAAKKDAKIMIAPVLEKGEKERVTFKANIAGEVDNQEDLLIDPFDTSDLLDQSQMDHRLELKLLDDQISALSNNIDIKNSVMKSYQDTAQKYKDMDEEFSSEMHAAQREIQTTQNKIDEVESRLQSDDLEVGQKEEFLAEQKKLLEKLEKSQQKLQNAENERRKLTSVKDESLRKINALNNELKLMREQKAAVGRQMKEEALAWKRFKNEQTKEIARLKAKLSTSEQKYAKLDALAKKSKPAELESVPSFSSPPISTGRSSSESSSTVSATTARGKEQETARADSRASKRFPITPFRKDSSSSASSASTKSTARSSNPPTTVRAESKRSYLPHFTKWLLLGLSNLIENRAIEAELEEEEESCIVLEQKMNQLKKVLNSKKNQTGVEDQVELEDKLDTIKAEVAYRRKKIEKARENLKSEEFPFAFEDLSLNDAQEIAKMAVSELIEAGVEIHALRKRIDSLSDELGQTQESLSQLEASIPLQELKNQEIKAELEAQHEQQLWYFMNQIEKLKNHLRQLDARNKSQNAQQQQLQQQQLQQQQIQFQQQLGSQSQRQLEVTEDQYYPELNEVLDESEQQQMWKAVGQMEKLKEQKYESLLERNDYLSRLVREQSHIKVKYVETSALLEKTEKVLSELLPVLQNLSQMTHVVDTNKKATSKSSTMSLSEKGGSIFDRLSDASAFTGMYKAIHDDMNERGIGHLGGRQSEKKVKKPKREVPNNLLEEAGELKGHNSTVFNVVTTQSNAFTCSIDYTIKVWDVDTQKDNQTLNEHKGPVRTLLAISNAVIVSTSEDKTIRVWDVRSNKCTRTINLDQTATSICLGENDKTFITGHEDGLLCLWTLDSIDKPVSTSRRHTGSVLALLNRGNHIATGSRDRLISLCNVSDLSLIRTLTHHHDTVTCLTEIDGNLISGSRDRQIKQHILEENNKVSGNCIVSAHGDWVNVLCASPDNKYLISGSKDSTMKVWDLSNNWNLASHVLTHDAAVHGMAWFRNSILLSTSRDGCKMHKIKRDGTTS